MNGIITSILFKARPDEVKFIFVDPKMNDMKDYEDLPHLLVPVIVDPKKAANALNWAVEEMEGATSSSPSGRASGTSSSTTRPSATRRR